MIRRMLPAGLLPSDSRIEFFNDPHDQEQCYLVTNGYTTRVTDAPEAIKEMIRRDIAQYPAKAEALVALGYVRDDAQLEKYCSCCFGAYDGQPDVVDGVLKHGEYWPCKYRGGECPVEGKLCDALTVGDGSKYLTVTEIKVLVLVAMGGYNKEIAYNLDISEETVKVHLKHIYEKTGLNHKPELVILAYQKNLI